MEVMGKAQEWCRLVWTGVEMWERGAKGTGYFLFAMPTSMA
jgi:hypothetical protein